MSEHKKGAEAAMGPPCGGDQGRGVDSEGADTDPGADCGVGSLRGMGAADFYRDEAVEILREEWRRLDERKRELQRTRERKAREKTSTKLIDRMISTVHRKRNEIEDLIEEVTTR